MLYSERAYFDGDHCAHVGAYEERNRLAGIESRARASRRRIRDR